MLISMEFQCRPIAEVIYSTKRPKQNTTDFNCLFGGNLLQSRSISETTAHRMRHIEAHTSDPRPGTDFNSHLLLGLQPSHKFGRDFSGGARRVWKETGEREGTPV